ncbi:hypothetical protein FC093_04630 [Ilyomonas limi]|uniref:TonB C-terminal domain-containing protein n=1 Tax=Ilyomonas limi TaxID=2575867 RepID=A0A4U3L7G8_9BACT|nr:hypothetical protein [Ilyomonas limi]TKK70972.1 hypothetical protein FC093_04630 [Ilyomonas limi]
MLYKKCLLAVCLAIVVCQSFAQAKTVKKMLSPSLVESYTVLKSNKYVKEGSYMVTDADNHVLVLGHYKNGKKDSIWNFMDAAGNVIQQYNYTDSALLLNNPDNNTIVQADYKLTDVNNSGKIDAPAQVGGANYGFYLLYDLKSVPPQVLNQTAVVKMTYNFDIDKSGKVKGCTVTYKGAGIDLTEAIPAKKFMDEAYTFLPARVDGQPVESNLLYTVDVNISKSRLPKQYTSPTSDGAKMSQGIYH